MSVTCPYAVFKCDPEKNTKCTKEGCFINGGPCQSTEEIAYAQIDEKGRIITCRPCEE